MHRTLIESVIRRFTWSAENLEDVMQNVFVKTIASIGGFDGKCRFSTWLYRVAVNECVDDNRRHLRKEKRFEPVEGGMDIFPDITSTDGLSDTISAEVISLLTSLITALPEGMRAACELYYMHQQTGEEAAATLQISVPAFFVRLSAARERLKKEMVKKGVVIC